MSLNTFFNNWCNLVMKFTVKKCMYHLQRHAYQHISQRMVLKTEIYLQKYLVYLDKDSSRYISRPFLLANNFVDNTPTKNPNKEITLAGNLASWMSSLVSCRNVEIFNLSGHCASTAI